MKKAEILREQVDMLGTIDNVIIPAIKRLNDKLKPIGDAFNKFGEMLGIEGLGDTLGKVALAAGGFSIISKRFRNFVGSFLGLFFSPKNIRIYNTYFFSICIIENIFYSSPCTKYFFFIDNLNGIFFKIFVQILFNFIM